MVVSWPQRRIAGARCRPSRRLAFKDEADFRYIGKGSAAIADLHDITVGKAIYGADAVHPGMKFAAGGAAAGGRRHGQVLRRGDGWLRPGSSGWWS